jgi:hypothetical protein
VLLVEVVKLEEVLGSKEEEDEESEELEELGFFDLRECRDDLRPFK